MSTQAGKVWWTELNAGDLEKAKEFYGTLFGWEFEAPEIGQGNYFMAMKDGVPAVGMLNTESIPNGENIPPNWFSYFAVDDINKSVDTTTANGGAIIRPPWEVSGIGKIAIISDSLGAVLGLVEPALAEQEG